MLNGRQAKYVKERLKGKNKKDAALAAGFPMSMALRSNKVETPDVKKAFAEIIRRHISGEKIANRISEGLDAKETLFFQSEGIVTDHRDVISWSERRRYAELAARYGGYHTPQVEVQGVIAHVLTPAEKREAQDTVKRLLEYEDAIEGEVAEEEEQTAKFAQQPQ